MVWLSLHACEMRTCMGYFCLGNPHPTLVHDGSGKLLSVDASAEPWGLAWHRRMPSSYPKHTAKVFRAFLRGTWTNDELGGPSLLAATSPMAPSHRSRTGHEWCGCRYMHAKCTHVWGACVWAIPHPTLVHNGNGKIMSVDVSSEPWGRAWHRRVPSSYPKHTAKVFRAFLRGTWTNDELGGPFLLATTSPMAPSHRSRTGHEWCGCR